MYTKLSLLVVVLSVTFTIQAQVNNRFDVVIDEIMADPSPQVNLPNLEWIELKNTTGSTINLQGCRIGDATGFSGAMPVFQLKPDSVVIVCGTSSAAAMSVYGAVISVTSFPSLDNTGDVIYLRNAQGKIIHAVNYTDDWYGNELKKDGGWSLEMIDTHNPCSGNTNWAASTNNNGGSPGKKNSIDAINADVTAPKILRAFASDNITLIVVFDEPLDSNRAAAVMNYTISDGIGNPSIVTVTAPVFDHVVLKLMQPLVAGKVYSISISGVTDCAGNNIMAGSTARVGISETANVMDVVINEILFNPKTNGTDYVEIYNRSKKIIDLKQLYIANRNTAGAVSSSKVLVAESQLLFPQDFMVITANPDIVRRDYITMNRDAFVTVDPMPSYNDDKGDVVLLNFQGVIVDELQYDEHWHFKLIANDEGIALERIDYNAETQNPDNWHSASSSAGYGTPTYKNSQIKTALVNNGTITISPEIISPDNDGRDDYTTISYAFPSAGDVANITIFDAAGRAVRYLQKNALCGTSGSFRWDGLGEQSQRLPSGVYIIYTAVFNLDGTKQQFKQTIVLARPRL
ncbi:MAG: lamin tail domain-containing protein [Bacteroidetes bacterium]|nr:lamin tail domain-containing protein [Bacteroidota bacterium]